MTVDDELQDWDADAPSTYWSVIWQDNPTKSVVVPNDPLAIQLIEFFRWVESLMNTDDPTPLDRQIMASAAADVLAALVDVPETSVLQLFREILRVHIHPEVEEHQRAVIQRLSYVIQTVCIQPWSAVLRWYFLSYVGMIMERLDLMPLYHDQLKAVNDNIYKMATHDSWPVLLPISGGDWSVNEGQRRTLWQQATQGPPTDCAAIDWTSLPLTTGILAVITCRSMAWRWQQYRSGTLARLKTWYQGPQLDLAPLTTAFVQDCWTDLRSSVRQAWDEDPTLPLCSVINAIWRNIKVRNRLHVEHGSVNYVEDMLVHGRYDIAGRSSLFMNLLRPLRPDVVFGYAFVEDDIHWVVRQDHGVYRFTDDTCRQCPTDEVGPIPEDHNIGEFLDLRQAYLLPVPKDPLAEQALECSVWVAAMAQQPNDHWTVVAASIGQALTSYPHPSPVLTWFQSVLAWLTHPEPDDPTLIDNWNPMAALLQTQPWSIGVRWSILRTLDRALIALIPSQATRLRQRFSVYGQAMSQMTPASTWPTL